MLVAPNIQYQITKIANLIRLSDPKDTKRAEMKAHYGGGNNKMYYRKKTPRRHNPVASLEDDEQREWMLQSSNLH